MEKISEASPIKAGVEEGKDILCFVHNVSPVKQSQKTAYFTAQLQTSNDLVRAVSFSPKRRSELCKYENAKSPVKVSKFKMSARKGYGNDVIINNYTSVTPASSESITFKYQPMVTSAVATISSLQNLSLEQLVSVHAKVLELSSVKVLHTAHGPLKKQEGVLVDETSSINIILWESEVEKLEEGQTYILSNLRLKESHGEKYVNTPKTGEFKFEAGEELKDLAEADSLPLEIISTISADIVGIASITKSLSCMGCKGKVVAEDDFLGVCSTCKMKQKIFMLSSKLVCKHSCTKQRRFLQEYSYSCIQCTIPEANKPDKLASKSSTC
ncbi:Hypothetical predicted protein [Paramuricea clavata]|uniref:Uncharacterized protein n=1 Tax=Paramuricea clavata TaxID=317549 RepID=A0A6S7HHF7_PARCT|nr:Hypothetical predicted protein [Paramuricea clavata]